MNVLGKYTPGVVGLARVATCDVTAVYAFSVRNVNVLLPHLPLIFVSFGIIKKFPA